MRQTSQGRAHTAGPPSYKIRGFRKTAALLRSFVKRSSRPPPDAGLRLVRVLAE